MTERTTKYSPMFLPIGMRMVYTDPKTGKKTVLFDYTDLEELIKREAKNRKRLNKKLNKEGRAE